jgi:hypothetical protein
VQGQEVLLDFGNALTQNNIVGEAVEDANQVARNVGGKRWSVSLVMMETGSWFLE